MSNTLPEELQRLLPLVSPLSAMQGGFNAYQDACFTARPGEFFALELNGEAGELANLEKKRWKGKAIPDQALGDEAADVLIALVNYCNARGLDLAGHVAAKLVEIERRRSEGTH
ncbi:MAG: hypothetical protein JJU11_03410 [Candidatus Sumerlaeia bacterium]|nr:hypothetical protein [Candidatus Sumerlaeia bacterium]